jgi:hypothetical protein
VIDEIVLRRPVGGHAVMLEQLRYLVDQSKRKNVVVQVNSSIDSAEREALAARYRMSDLNDRGPAAALWSVASPVADVVAGLLSLPKHRRARRASLACYRSRLRVLF